MAERTVLMPRLSDTMAEGIITRWLREEGDVIEKGEPIVEIETEKTSLTLEAEDGGILTRILAREGTSVAVGSVIAVIEPPSAASEIGAGRRRDRKGPGERATGVVSALSGGQASVASGSAGGAVVGGGTALEGDGLFFEDEPPSRMRATPIARALAASMGIDLGAVGPGSGPEGRILQSDVESALAKMATQGRGQAADVGIPRGGATGEVEEPTRVQRIIARRTTQAKQEIPHFYVDIEIDMADALELQSQLRRIDPPTAVSVTDMVVRACGLALREIPKINRSWLDGRLVRHSAVNVGMAVALENEGVIIPVVRDVDRKSLADIAYEAKELAAKARRSELTPEEISGGTFTISNLGMFAVKSFHAIINPPESGILAIGGITSKIAVQGDTFLARRVMTVSLSADHRVYSGVTAARFLHTVRRILERPLLLLLPPVAARAETGIGEEGLGMRGGVERNRRERPT